MSVDVEAKLLYGATYEELSEVVEGLDRMLDHGEIDYASPYYDSGRDEWIVGVYLPDEVDGEAEMVEAIRAARVKFFGLTSGQPGRIIVSPHVT